MYLKEMKFNLLLLNWSHHYPNKIGSFSSFLMSSSYRIFLEKNLIVDWFIRKLRPCAFAGIEIYVNSAGLQIIQKKD